MDAYGYLQLKGRLKDLIIRGGENIYPAEIENTLQTHPKVKLVQVSSRPLNKAMGGGGLVGKRFLWSLCVSLLPGDGSAGFPYG